jgi:hypothetical protein
LGENEAQREIYLSSRDLLYGSYNFWKSYGSQVKKLSESKEDERIWKVAAADLVGLAHGSIFGPWFAAVESIIVSAGASDVLND